MHKLLSLNSVKVWPHIPQCSHCELCGSMALKVFESTAVVDCCGRGNELPSGGDRSEDVEREMHGSKRISNICNGMMRLLQTLMMHN